MRLVCTVKYVYHIIFPSEDQCLQTQYQKAYSLHFNRRFSKSSLKSQAIFKMQSKWNSINELSQSQEQ